MAVKKGDKVKVEYTGSFDDGTVFDSSEKHGQPLEFEAGEGKVIKGFDEALIGMESGEEKEIHIKPEDGYGMPNPQMVKKIPREHIPKDHEPKEGMVLAIGLPNGQQIPARITEVSDNDVTVDMNHPLAGKALNFKIKLV